MYSKQARFEAFLNAQQTRQQARWFRDVPAILFNLTTVIQDLKGIVGAHPNFEAKSLPKLRELYKTAMTAQNGNLDYTAYCDSRKAIANRPEDIEMMIRLWHTSKNA